MSFASKWQKILKRLQSKPMILWLTCFWLRCGGKCIWWLGQAVTREESDIAQCSRIPALLCSHTDRGETNRSTNPSMPCWLHGTMVQLLEPESPSLSEARASIPGTGYSVTTSYNPFSMSNGRHCRPTQVALEHGYEFDPFFATRTKAADFELLTALGRYCWLLCLTVFITIQET